MLTLTLLFVAACLVGLFVCILLLLRPKPAAVPSLRKRNYVVLMRIGDQHWLPITAQYARSPTRAINQAIKDTALTPGWFVAVEVIHWKPEVRPIDGF